jgi:hypothetical protein
MARRRRVLPRFRAWIGPALILLIGSAWVSTRWYASALAVGCVSVGVNDGGFKFNVYNQKLIKPSSGLHVVRNPLPLAWKWKPVFRRNPTSTLVWIPLWMPLTLVVVATAVGGTLRVRGRIRRRFGHCPKCGYDLRGLQAGSPCPECGRAGAPAID